MVDLRPGAGRELLHAMVLRFRRRFDDDWMGEPLNKSRLFFQGMVGIMVAFVIIIDNRPRLLLGLVIYMIIWRPLTNIVLYYRTRKDRIVLAGLRTRSRELRQESIQLQRQLETQSPPAIERSETD